MNEEISKNVLDRDTEDLLNKFSLIGDRILILLDKAEGHTTTSTGIYIPLNELVETEAGKLAAETSKRVHLAQGTILKMGTVAFNKLADLEAPLKPGDRVYLHPSSTNKAHEFFPDRTKLVQDFNGFICVPHTLIEAKITN